MPAFALNIIATILPYILGFFAIIGVYFGIKQKGRNEEREKQQKLMVKQQQNLTKAVGKDVQVDKKVADTIHTIEEIKEGAKDEVENADPKPGDKFTF